jgi:ATPases involved in chromosome partitioning
MAKIITFANQKGGVGKTTTSHIVSIGIAKKGYKVLACDLDPQANLTSVLGIDPDSDIVSIYDLFEGDCDITDAIVKTEAGVDLLVGSLMLSGADRKYSATGDEYKLKEALEIVKDNYDYIIIDTPPALGVMSLNGLATTDYLTVVMTPDYFSGKGLKQFQQTVETTKKYLNNPNLKINGLLLTRCDRTNLSSIINDDMEEVATSLDSKIYKSRIRQGVAIRESQYLESSLYDMKDTAVLEDYNNFIEELLKEV